MTITITIRRPEGHTETKDVSNQFSSMNDALFARIQKATADAGRGEVLSYDVVEEVYTPTPEDDLRDARYAWDRAIHNGDPIVLRNARTRLLAAEAAVARN